jgi:hypothetical protein
LNELAFVPVDYRPNAPLDEWSGDCCGAQYFSQQAVDGVASGAGIQFPEGLGLPEKLVAIQKKVETGDPLAARVYETRNCKRSNHTFGGDIAGVAANATIDIHSG